MKREQKMGLVGIFVIGLLAITPVFQNCAKTNYDTIIPTNTVLGVGVSRKLTVDPTYNQQKANMKVLFVVDDSYTMSQSQTQLANAIDSLLTPLQGHNVNFKIVSTSGVPSNEVDYNITTQYMTEARLSIPQAQAAILPSYLVQKSIVNNSTRHPALQLSKSATSAQFTQVKNQIKNAILSVGVSGSDVEEGLCATARQLFDVNSSSFFKAGDKAAIVILTDENDSSQFSKCVTRYIQRVASQPVVYYTYGQQRAKLTLEYQLERDGVKAWYPVIWGVALSGQQNVTDGAACSVADQTAAVNKIAAEYVIRNVSSCVYETVPASYYGSDLGDNGSDPTKNLCNSTVYFNNQSFANLYAFVNGTNKSARAGSCVRDVLPGNAQSASIEFDSVIKSDTVSANSQNLSYAIRNKAVELFGSSGFTVASLIRKYGESCALNQGQSYGVSYEGLAQVIGSANATSQSLCAADFSTTLAQVSNFIVSEADSSYVLAIQSNESVQSVVVIRNSQRITLSTSEYEVVGSTMTLTNFTLQSGDRIEVTLITN